MQPNLMPFNIDLLLPTKQDVAGMTPVTVLDINDGLSKNFHPNGLFSIEIFGKVGEERRNRMFSYIDLHTRVLHPVIFKTLTDLRQLYGSIMSGSEYATFDATLGDFVLADASTGDTGYEFFLQHMDQLKLDDRGSPKRTFAIKLLDKYRGKSLMERMVVMPAGLRDYSVDEDGKPTEDEINGMYRAVLSISNLTINSGENDLTFLDTVRYNLQNKVLDIYIYIKGLLEGKKKLILGKWASRKVYNSTRNVITSYIHYSDELFDETSVSTNDTVLGMYQYMRATLPLAVNLVKDTLSDVFVGVNSPANMVNKKTMLTESVEIPPKLYDSWMTYEGLEKNMARFGEESIRHDPLETDTHYFGLIYEGPDGSYKILHSIADLPEDRDVNHVRPLTMTDLFYLSIYERSRDMPCLVTRYPITGYGSIYPSMVYLKSTVDTQVRVELGDDWEPTSKRAVEFPTHGGGFYNSMAVSSSHLGRLGAD